MDNVRLVKGLEQRATCYGQHLERLLQGKRVELALVERENGKLRKMLADEHNRSQRDAETQRKLALGREGALLQELEEAKTTIEVLSLECKKNREELDTESEADLPFPQATMSPARSTVSLPIGLSRPPRGWGDSTVRGSPPSARSTLS
eukprot:CAMPEP_0118989556 /NCGR_PEP_ID=MMETSP1173-20130426/48226_1 /TAXON_ID=1034831 /ORGANISM="Rhizochromulina marina cf, Strain CCMP1243" /LENGTH=148 /DNA_ID=CAMNT_0006940553 /DNA_START=22 /DNA_END=464 /DNA_ORIENTATION=+